MDEESRQHNNLSRQYNQLINSTDFSSDHLIENLKSSQKEDLSAMFHILLYEYTQEMAKPTTQGERVLVIKAQIELCVDILEKLK